RRRSGDEARAVDHLKPVEDTLTHRASPSNRESECVTVAHDAACGASGKMRADDQRRGSGQASQHRLTGAARRCWIRIRGRGPFRPGDLAGVVHEVYGDQRRLAPRGDSRADVTRGMAWGRDETDLVADPVIGLNKIDKAGIPDRCHRIREDRGDVLALMLLRPMYVFDLAHQVAGIRKGWDPPALDQHRIPADVIDV